MIQNTMNATTEEVQARDFSVPAEESQLSRVRDFITGVCDDAGFSTRETNNTKLAVDEACTNIIKHAYKDIDGEIRIHADIRTGKVDIRISDTGKKFDFAGVKDPDLDQYVETGRKGGLGVFLINRLMDGVQYHTSGSGNELVLTKQSHGAVSRVLPAGITWRGSLRYKFTLRASVGLFVLIAIIGSFTFVRQTGSLKEQRANQWMEKKRLAQNVSTNSVNLLEDLEKGSWDLLPEHGTALTKAMTGNPELGYVRVVDAEGIIASSGNIGENFEEYLPPDGDIMLQEESGIVWMRHERNGMLIRDIAVPVRTRDGDTGRFRSLGVVHVGVFEDILADNVRDPRLMTMTIIVVIFLVGILLIMGLVSVFVKPIQVLTDGVRAIGQGSLDGKINVEGPAEIGAIASVFNEITEKFKKAQDSVLEQEKLQKEIEVAKQIQHALLPKRHPDVSGYDIAPYYQAAKEVGGDYYDFVQVDEDTLGVVVADVSGKGVPGSLVMTMIRTALRMEARGNKNASDVMSKMNDFVTDDMKKGMFVTMFYVILDSKNRIISYASAGHNPMILYRAETNDTYFLNPKGFPVGISLPDEQLFRRAISLEKIKLKKNDMLLIYTDGVTEAMNERREQFGEDRLLATIKEHGHLHPEEFIRVLEREIKKFTGGNAQNDDITVVAVKEKLAADDVLSGLRKKLIDMVDVQGMSVKEACAEMKVSPTTYYRYKKRVALMGERGLKNKVLREDMDIKRVSLEERKELLRIIAEHPEYGAKRLAEEYNKGKEEARHISQKLVYDELKRLNLNTKELRLDYLKRNRILMDADAKKEAKRSNKEMVDDLLKEFAKEPAEPTTPSEPAAPAPPVPDVIDQLETLSIAAEDESADLSINVAEVGGDVTVLEVDGHLDSVSTPVLEKRLSEVISGSVSKIAVDLSKVSYISSGGWGSFVGEVKRLRERGGDVVLLGMTAEVYDVYELLGFNEILKSFADVDGAIAYFGKPVEERFASEKEAASRPDETVSLVNEIKDGGYVTEWESLQIEAATVGGENDIAVLSLNGIIDTISAENLRAAIDRVISNGIHRIVVDMSQVEYVSSGGWGTFTERLREVRRSGGDIKLFGMDPDVYYVFTMLGFNIVLSSFDILTEAIEDFGQSLDDKPSVHPEQDRPQATDEATDIVDEVEAEEALVADLIDNDVQPARQAPTELLHWAESGGALIGSLSGMIEASAVEEITGAIEARIASKPNVLLFDLSAVEYISSTGWGMFAKYHEQLLGWGGSMALCGMDHELYEIFSCLEFNSFMKTHVTLEEALQATPNKTATTDRVKEKPVEDSTRQDDVASVDELTEVMDEETPGIEAGIDEPSDTLDVFNEKEDGTDTILESEPEEGDAVTEKAPAAEWDSSSTIDTPVDDHDETDAVTGAPANEPEGTGAAEDASTEANDQPDVVLDAPASELEESIKGWELVPIDDPQSGRELAATDDENGKPEKEQEAFVDFDENDSVEVSSDPVEDQTSAEDRLIRTLGWKEYGAKLRKKNSGYADKLKNKKKPKKRGS